MTDKVDRQRLEALIRDWEEGHNADELLLKLRDELSAVVGASPLHQVERLPPIDLSIPKTLVATMKRIPAPPEWVRLMEQLIHEVEWQRAWVPPSDKDGVGASPPQPTFDALRSLTLEISGLLAIGEQEMRGVLGNTNVNCLKRKIEQAAQALAGSASREGDSK